MLIDPDFDFELFPASEAGASRVRPWMVVAAVAAFWFVDRPFAVATALVAVALPDFREGRRLLRAVPDRAGAWICALFRFAWGAWKAGAVGLGLGLLATATVALEARLGWNVRPTASNFFTVVPPSMVWTLGLLVSAGLTAAGMLVAMRSGMRVWIGEGVNHARLLLLSMMLSTIAAGAVALAYDILSPRGHERSTGEMLHTVLRVAVMWPIGALFLLDRISRRVVAERPGKFGPKVPSVGKWNV